MQIHRNPRIGKALLGQLYEGELNAILMFVKYAVNRGQEIQLPVEINHQNPNKGFYS